MDVEMGSDVFADIQLSGLNDSSQILTALCSPNSSSVEPHVAPGSGRSVPLLRVIFDLYVVGLICLIGFLGE